MKDKFKKFKRNIKRLLRREVLIKIVIVISGLLLVLTSVLPYIL